MERGVQKGCDGRPVIITDDSGSHQLELMLRDERAEA